MSEGEILINGVNIQTIELGKLRNLFGVIMQTPFMFGFDLKKNIDPEGCYTEDHILSTLQTVLGRKVTRNQLNLKTVEMSDGEKQLISMCRCLLKETPILVLD